MYTLNCFYLGLSFYLFMEKMWFPVFCGELSIIIKICLASFGTGWGIKDIGDLNKHKIVKDEPKTKPVETVWLGLGACCWSNRLLKPDWSQYCWVAFVQMYS